MTQVTPQLQDLSIYELSASQEDLVNAEYLEIFLNGITSSASSILDNTVVIRFLSNRLLTNSIFVNFKIKY